MGGRYGRKHEIVFIHNITERLGVKRERDQIISPCKKDKNVQFPVSDLNGTNRWLASA